MCGLYYIYIMTGRQRRALIEYAVTHRNNIWIHLAWHTNKIRMVKYNFWTISRETRHVETILVFYNEKIT